MERLRRFSLLVVLAISPLVSGVARQVRTAPQGGISRRQQPSVAEPEIIIAQGRGVSHPRPRSAAKLPPLRTRPLDAAMLRSVVSRLPGKPRVAAAVVPAADFVTLTARQPVVPDRGYLMFESPATVEPYNEYNDDDYVGWNITGISTPNGSLGIYLKPEHAGQSFVVSVSLLTFDFDTPFNVSLPDGQGQSSRLTVRGKSISPIIIFFTAQDAGWQQITINHGLSKAAWFFSSCEAKTVQL